MRVDQAFSSCEHRRVPWRPRTTTRVVPDQRIDPYRDRAAFLYSGEEKTATLFVRVETWWRQEGGHLWWRRWSGPREALHGFLLTEGGAFDDFVIWSENDLTEELAAWQVGQFMYHGERFRVVWLDEAEAQSVRDAFGLDEGSSTT